MATSMKDLRGRLQTQITISPFASLVAGMSVVILVIGVVAFFWGQQQIQGLDDQANTYRSQALEAQQSPKDLQRISSELAKNMNAVRSACAAGANPSVAVLALLSNADRAKAHVAVTKSTIALETPPPAPAASAAPQTQATSPATAAPQPASTPAPLNANTAITYTLTVTINATFPQIVQTMRSLVDNPLAVGLGAYNIQGGQDGGSVLTGTMPLTIRIPSAAVCGGRV